MLYATKVTIIIPLRIDSQERKRNLHLLLKHLYISGIKVILLEADSRRLLQPLPEYPSIDYLFVKDNNPIFHRTYYLNQMIKKCSTPIVGVFDSDAILSYSQIEESLKAIYEKDCAMSYPYNGVMNILSKEESELYEKSPSSSFFQTHSTNFTSLMGRPAYGGAFFVCREKYLLCGGENEYFYGWGPEDAERFHRMRIMGHSIHRSQGPLFHLWHPRGKNSSYANKEQAIINRLEFVKICGMHANELKKYITSWDWTEY